MKIKSNLFEFEGSPIELLILNYWINNYKCRVVVNTTNSNRLY